MRLTLRTLLAYLDDVLEPSQTKELGEKINESGFAANLMAKIKDVMRRRRLSAPALTGPGAGIDCNIVGEYLDSTLAPDKVADVEKICLESDVHLAEVAACHQVLTLVLHEPVEISPESKARLYALSPDGGAGNPQSFASETYAPAEEAPVLDRPSKVTGVKALDTPQADIAFAVPEQPRPVAAVTASSAAPTPALPEYLRKPASNRRWVGYVVVLLVGIAWGVSMIKYSPFTPSNPAPQPAAPSQPRQGALPVEVAKNFPKTSDDPEILKQRTPESADKKKSPVEPDTKSPAPDKGPVPADVKIGVPAKKDPSKVDTPPVDVPAKSNEKTVAATPGSDAKDPGKKMAPSTDPGSKSGETKPDVVATAKPLETTKSAEKVEKTETPPVTLPPAPPVAAALAPAAVIYKFNDGVVLHYDRKPAGWFVLGPQAHIHPEDRLAVPEPFEGLLRVDDGVLNVSLRGGTAVRMLPPTSTTNFGCEVQRGKMLVRRGTEGEQPVSMQLKIRQLVWRIELLTPDTQFAVQVDPVFTDRLDQDLGDRTVTAALHVATGAVRLSRIGAGTEPGVSAEPAEFAGPTSQALTPDLPPEILNAMFRWVGPYSLTQTQSRFIKRFVKKFEGGDKVELSLTADDSKMEISLLETECLGLIGAYGPLVTIMQRTEFAEVRRAAIDGLRIWLPQQPGRGKILKTVLNEQFPPDDAADLYRLLWGFNAEDLRNRATSTALLDWMETAHIAIRELAFQQVFRLTKKSYDYRANSSERKLKDDVGRFRTHLQKNGALLPPAPAP